MFKISFACSPCLSSLVCCVSSEAADPTLSVSPSPASDVEEAAADVAPVLELHAGEMNPESEVFLMQAGTPSPMVPAAPPAPGAGGVSFSSLRAEFIFGHLAWDPHYESTTM